jgi:glycine C-acetyltransferase
VPTDRYGRLRQEIEAALGSIRAAGSYKKERVLETPQGRTVRVAGSGRELLVLCSNNYLGLTQHPRVVAAAAEALRDWGYGLASVRFICGTQLIHKELERKLSEFLTTEDTILYTSCFDANAGLFEALLGGEDAIVTDERNHASLIDGIRLSKAQRFQYRHGDMADLAARLTEAASARFRLIVTDGVFSMDGHVADLPAICDLAQSHDALVMIDDSHGLGVLGATGRGTPEHHGVMDRVDILTGTLGKALGGANGGFTTGRKEIIELLRQRSRPYLFSNTLAPAVVAGSMAALDLLSSSTALRDRLHKNTAVVRQALPKLGFDVLPGLHPIVPIMVGDAATATRFAEALLERGVYIVGFSHPVVPHGTARLRLQVSAAHTAEDLTFAMEQLAYVREQPLT